MVSLWLRKHASNADTTNVLAVKPHGAGLSCSYR